jgi:hypothetical protein
VYVGGRCVEGVAHEMVGVPSEQHTRPQLQARAAKAGPARRQPGSRGKHHAGRRAGISPAIQAGGGHHLRLVQHPAAGDVCDADPMLLGHFRQGLQQRLRGSRWTVGGRAARGAGCWRWQRLLLLMLGSWVARHAGLVGEAT